jgi:predicted membrane channel-forming protein YqfA (hemolysin III family)
MDMFVGEDVTCEEVDNVVNTVTLMNALILTVPYGIMTAANFEYWDWVESTLDACPSTKFSYHQDFRTFSSTFNAAVYSTICVLIMAMFYYLLRPKDDTKFRHWWKSTRYVVILMLIGTITAVVSLVAVSNWLFSWYMIPTSKLCTYSATSQNIVGIIMIVLTALPSLYLML